MCGIFFYKGEKYKTEDLVSYLEKLNDRGPDNKKILQVSDNIVLGFTRLCINDLSENGDQPFYKNGIYLICNGEIYNFRQLIDENKFEMNSSSDCEVIIDLYLKYGMNECCTKLDGVFSFVIVDTIQNKVFACRDRFGVRPGYIGRTETNEIFVASELKAISDLCTYIEPFQPGNFLELTNDNDELFNYQPYYRYLYNIIERDEEILKNNIRELLTEAVRKRVVGTLDVPCGCLLSGGLDSSLVTAIANQYFPKGELNTFSIGMKGSTDLHYAKIAAEYLGTNHHQVELTEQDFLNAIEEVIYHIGSFDTTTVRASTGNYLISKYIKENTDIRVVTNGDGSEEIWASYRYAAVIEDKDDFFEDNLRLLKQIHYYDVLRSDRSISNNGLEARTPFLDRDLVNYVMSIDPKWKQFGFNGKMEKQLLRNAFKDTDLLPDEILNRGKEAFSDGVSSQKNSWFEVLHRHIDTKITDEEFENEKDKFTHCTPRTKEEYYYRKIFEKYYKGHSNIIPAFWMPNKKYYPDMVDPSARKLKTYSNSLKEN
jgi:asparagine synthase (glutamine-hydrolysing)